MKYIDIHCHLDFVDYEIDKAEVLGRMKEKEVGAITIGTDFESSERAVTIACNIPNIWACVGVHPNEGGVFSEIKFEDLMHANREKIVAIGECGLDYFRLESHSAEATRDKQKANFEKQINFAIKHDRPLMLHCRNAYRDVLEILGVYKKQAGDKLRGDVHFFAGSIEEAKRFLDLGFTLSFTGVITFTHDYDEVIKYLPIEKIMSETDAPYVAPVPYRGKRNEPAYVVEVIKKLAELKETSESDMASQILQNAQKMFNLKILN
jgi:TatD DNase family protein